MRIRIAGVGDRHRQVGRRSQQPKGDRERLAYDSVVRTDSREHRAEEVGIAQRRPEELLRLQAERDSAREVTELNQR